MNFLFFTNYKPLQITAFIFIFLLVMFNISANSRYINAEGQKLWVSDEGEPVVEVFIKGASVFAKVRAVDLPAIELKKINSNLLNENTEQFILIRDFNQDGLMDVGVMKSIGYGSGDRCYSVFEYKPAFYSFSSRVSKTVCIK